MTTLHEAAQKAIYWLDQNGGAHIADELREALEQQWEQRCDTARVLEWMRTPNRKAAQLAFTEGPERQAAYWIEIAQGEQAPQPTCKQDLQVPTVKENLTVETEQERYVRMCPDIECGRKKRCTRMVGVSCMSRADIAPAAQPLSIEEVEQINAQWNYEIHGDRTRYIARMVERAHGIGVQKQK